MRPRRIQISPGERWGTLHVLHEDVPTRNPSGRKRRRVRVECTVCGNRATIELRHLIRREHKACIRCWTRDVTPRQLQVLAVIHEHMMAHGYPPTMREIGDKTGIGSTNGVNDHLHALAVKGLIRRGSRKARALHITDKGLDAIGEAREAAE